MASDAEITGDGGIQAGCCVSLQCPRQNCGKDRRILVLEIHDSCSWVGGADGIVAKEIKHLEHHQSLVG